MESCPRSLALLLALAWTWPAPAIDLPGFGGGGGPGDEGWWRRARRSAVFEPGKGYRVEGVEGYLDEQGRPISAPVDEVAVDFTGEEVHKGLLPSLDPHNAYKKMKAAVGMGPNQETAKNALAEAERLIADEKYQDAEAPLKLAIDRWPNSVVHERAQFLLAESYFYRDRYRKARDAYDELVADFPSTRYLDTLVQREWAIGEYWERMWEKEQRYTLQPNLTDTTQPTFDTIGHAIKAYESIRLNDPTGSWADDAIMKTANSYFRRGRFFDADENYALLRQEYPRSEHQFEAHLLGLQSKLRMYQGADYDGTPLEEAQVLLRQLRVQFSQRLSDEEQDRLRKVAAELELAVDQRTMSVAKYYDAIEQYAAAKVYYRELAQRRPGSELGKEAMARFQALGGLPDEPEKPLGWFVDLFPESRERSAIAKLQKQTEEAAPQVAEEKPPTVTR